MPDIEFTTVDLSGIDLDNETIQAEHNAMTVWAHMCYPQDEAKRNQFLAVWWAFVLHGYFTDPAFELSKFSAVVIPEDVLYITINSPSLSEVVGAVDDQVWRAALAGQVLFNVFIMDALGIDEPGLNKGLWLTAEANKIWIETKLTGRRLPTTDRRVRKCWEDFKTVSHFWAAYVALNDWLGMNLLVDNDKPTNYPAGSVNAFRNWGTQPYDFLAISELIFFRWGTEFKSGRVRIPQPIIPADAWTVPELDPELDYEEMKVSSLIENIDPLYLDWIRNTLKAYPNRHFDC